jgi:hypothetical protein
MAASARQLLSLIMIGWRPETSHVHEMLNFQARRRRGLALL